MIKISIITINYNNAHGLNNTIKSVAEQQCSDFEFIVIDGGSTDESLDVIKQSANKINKWVSEKDNGIYHAQNKGIQKAEGDYCLFLNSGDTLHDKKIIENVIPYLNRADIVYGDIVTLNAKGEQAYLKSPEKIGVYEMMISTIWHPTAFIKRELFEKHGGYNENFKVTGDYEFFIRAILRENASTFYINQNISVFDLGGISNTEASQQLQIDERKRSWQLNFSEVIIKAFEDKTRILRSREYKLAKLINNIKSVFVKKR